jgi:hypothetical protein
MKDFIILVLALTLVLAGCSAGPAPENTDAVVDSAADESDDSIEMDVDLDGDADVAVETMDDTVEAVVEMDEELIQEAQDVTAENLEEFCVPGETYSYTSEEGSVDSVIIGLTMYEGSEFCEAISQTTMESPAGEMVTDTTYYFDTTYEEYWIVTTMTADFMPEGQTNRVHLVNGVVQE